MTTIRDLDHSLPLQLLKAREAAMASFRPMLRGHGLTEQQWRVIRVLTAYPDIDATNLAQRTLLLAPSLTRILKRMQSNGLVARHVDRLDQRRATFALTQVGNKLYASVGPDSERLYQHIESEFGQANLEQLYTLLAEFSRTMQA